MRANEPTTSDLLDHWLERLAKSLSTVVNILDPDVFVFGGSMANVSEIYSKLPAKMKQHVFSDHWFARLRPAKWGDASGVRGAARL